MKKVFLCLLFFLSSLISFTAYGDLFTVGDFNYQIIESDDFPSGCVELYSPAKDYMTTIDIPSTISYQGNNYTVVVIRERAFESYSSMTELNLPSTLQEIQAEAFYGCNLLREVELPSSLKRIGGGVFSRCTSIVSIVIPSSVEYLPNSTFANCSSLTEINVETANQYYSSFDGVLYDKSGESLILCPPGKREIKFNNQVRTIKDASFRACEFLKEVNIPLTVKKIENYAFGESVGLEKVYMGDSVTDIEESIFSLCAYLKTVRLSQALKVIPAETFAWCLSLESVEMPEKLEIIGNGAFSNINHLTLDIPKTVSYIGEGAFDHCGIESLVLPPKLQNISKRCFASTAIKEIIIPEGVTMIGDEAFQWGQLKEITIPSTVNFIGNEAFTFNSDLRLVICDAANPPAAQNAFDQSEFDEAYLQVNSSSLSRYQTTQPWNQFKNIIDKNFVPVESVTISLPTKIINAGETVDISTVISPQNATSPQITWEVLEGTVDIDKENGRMTVNEAGNIRIRIIATNGAGYAEAETEALCLQIDFNSIPSDGLNPGNEFQIETTLYPLEYDNRVIIYESSNPAVAKISDSGLLNALTPGTTLITAFLKSTPNIKSSFELSVRNIMPESIELRNTPDNLKIGETIQLEATVYPENTTDKTIKWNSSDPNIATVSDKGLVTAVSAGEVIITATCGEVSADCQITILTSIIQPEEIVLNLESAELNIGEVVQLEAIVLPDDATDKSISWNSSDPNIATVSDKGLVTAVSAGEVIITATCGEVSADCQITILTSIIQPEEIVLNLESGELNIGEVVQLEATVLPDDTTDKSVSWNSLDPNIATVSDSGLVTAVSAGYAIITATCGDVSAECVITVLEDAGVDSLLANPDSKISIYTTEGILIKKDCNVEDLKKLNKGIYIIVSGKDRYKISI